MLDLDAIILFHHDGIDPGIVGHPRVLSSWLLEFATGRIDSPEHSTNDNHATFP